MSNLAETQGFLGAELSPGGGFGHGVCGAEGAQAQAAAKDVGAAVKNPPAGGNKCVLKTVTAV